MLGNGCDCHHCISASRLLTWLHKCCGRDVTVDVIFDVTRLYQFYGDDERRFIFQDLFYYRTVRSIFLSRQHYLLTVHHMLRPRPSIYARRFRFVALLALAVLLPISTNAFRVLETKLVFSKAETPDMSKCLAPAEEAKSVFQLSTGFVWYWVKLKDYVHDRNVTIRVRNPVAL